MSPQEQATRSGLKESHFSKFAQWISDFNKI